MAFVFRTAILASALALALSSASSQPIAAQAPPAEAAGGEHRGGWSLNTIAHSSRLSAIT